MTTHATTHATTHDEMHARAAAVFDEMAAAGFASERSRALREALTSEVLAYQFATLPISQLTQLREVADATTWWRAAVPSLAFRKRTLFAGAPEAVVQTFASSGTSDAANRARAHYSQAGLDLMRHGILINAREMLFGDLFRDRLDSHSVARHEHEVASTILVIAPSPAMAPQMIMAWGMARLIERFGTGASGFLIEGPTLDVGAVIGRLLAASEAATPVTLIGASFGFVHVLDELARRGERISLPPSSRVMDAGGFKGRSREVAPEALRAMMVEWLGVRETHCVNLLGMTELASQLYDDRLRAHVAGRAAKRGKVGPPWCATVALDPETLARCEDEVPGMLAHLDLANVERPAVVRTTDIGVTHGDGSFSIWGRAQSDDAAGCSLAIEEFAARASGA